MSFNFSDNNIAQYVSNEIQRKYHLENFQSMPTDRLIENLYRLVYDIIIYDENDKQKVTGSYYDTAMKVLALDVLQRLKNRHIPYE